MFFLDFILACDIIYIGKIGGVAMIPLGYLSGIGYGLFCLVIALVLYKLGMPKIYTRKVVHILVGFEWVFLYHFFGAGVHFLIVCLAFLALLLLAYIFKLMPMISSDDDNAPGTVYYAVAMTGVSIIGCFLPDIMLPFGLGIFCTSIGDGMAGLIGQLFKKNNPKIYQNKTVFGFLANFCFSYLSAIVMTFVFTLDLGVIEWCIIAFVSAMIELVSEKGLDNISVTWGITALTYGFMYFPEIYNYILPIVFTPVIIAFVRTKKSLTDMAVIAAIITDLFISVSLGNFGFVILVLFFGLSILLDKVKKKIKNNREFDEALKGDCRDHMQVIANGLVPALMAILFFISKSPIFVIAFVASLSEALGDTVASALGAFSEKTVDIFKWKKCENGLSGGVSVIGTIGSLVFSFVLPIVSVAFGAFDISVALIVALCAFAGTVIDSALGSLFQVKFRCSTCGKITEKHYHCDKATEYYGGVVVVDNDVVNLLSGLFSALLSIVVSLVFLA